jgi:hypothetical protein
VPLAEGVVDLGHHRGQRAVDPVAVPEADRLEDIAQHPRVGVQPDLAVASATPSLASSSSIQASASARPSPWSRSWNAEQSEAVACQRGGRALAQGAHRQQQEVGGVGEGVGGRAQPAVAHLADADLRAVVHAASPGRQGRPARRQRVGHGQPGHQAVLVEPVACPGAGEPQVRPALDAAQPACAAMAAASNTGWL